MPTKVLNYVIGVSNISLKDNILSFLGWWPFGAFEAFIGSELTNFDIKN